MQDSLSQRFRCAAAGLVMLGALLVSGLDIPGAEPEGDHARSRPQASELRGEPVATPPPLVVHGERLALAQRFEAPLIATPLPRYVVRESEVRSTNTPDPHAARLFQSPDVLHVPERRSS